MRKLFATFTILAGLAVLVAHQAGRLALPSWGPIGVTAQTTVDRDASAYAEQFKQIHLQAEKDVLAHKYSGPTAANDLHEWLKSACEKARAQAFSGVSKPLSDALTGPDGKSAAFHENRVAAACHKIATE
jgi:hypothetical protein